MMKCSQWSVKFKVWNLIHSTVCFKYFKLPKTLKNMSANFLMRNCQKETHHITPRTSLEVPTGPVVWILNTFWLPFQPDNSAEKKSCQAIGLANISKCDALRVPGANNWTNTTVIEAWTAGAKGEGLL